MTIAMPFRRAVTLAAPFVRDSLWRRARAVPSLDLRFADNKSLVDAVTGASLVTFNRASSGTFVDSARVLQTASTDVPRFDHNPTTGESLGLLVEEQRVNGITNNTMVGAVAGTPGTLPTGWPFQSGGGLGLSVSIVGTGTESGINYLDWRISGTASANTSATVCFGRPSALTAQTWTSSSYLKLAAGSLSGVTGMTLDLIEETAATVFVTGAGYSITLPTTNSLITQRPTASRTLTGGATIALLRNNLSLFVSSGSTVDFTLRIGLPQLEQGAFATSPILTSTAAATRSADVCSITGSAFSGWYRQDEGTVFTQYIQQPARASSLVAQLSDNSAANRIGFQDLDGTTPRWFQVRSSSSEGSAAGAARTAGAIVRHALRMKTNDFRAAYDGILTAQDSSIICPTVSQLDIGKRETAAELLNGRISRITFWPAGLTDSTLQGITQ